MKKVTVYKLAVGIGLLIIVFPLLFMLFRGGKQPEGSKPTSTIKDISTFQKKISASVEMNLPPEDILNSGGVGLRLYDNNSNFVNGDQTLQYNGKTLQYFLSTVWLQPNISEVYLAVVLDNRLQEFSVDGSQEKNILYKVEVQPKSVINIPISFTPFNDGTNIQSQIKFLLISDLTSTNAASESVNAPNVITMLQYKLEFAKSNVKENDSVLETKNYENKESIWSSVPNTGAFNWRLEKDDTNQLYFKAMGECEDVTTFFFLDNQLISGFNGKEYLHYHLTKGIILNQLIDIKITDENKNKMLFAITLENKPDASLCYIESAFLKDIKQQGT